ncbi:hypothetical protein PFICI_05942 [Pestalotiopsis fici W106-1]|uniref:5'-deoxynucleotidase n=1 Tax=Pestalotiopsis fici (strain W106-1 / CGMCC3.15140) TaxID=1229662 RepID=W3XFS5_PESFW|nr:uncharacterized protein PFICI_05942 [Pestalotiopsis fici W106-1]ETS84066.1 hypothetical protein PFICI_05942 [Pestalotiopsis fici W106-1]
MIQHPESVASHSFGVAWLSMLLAPSDLNRSRCLLIGICHDLAESVIGDIPTYAGVAKDQKHKLEANAFKYLCSLLSEDLAREVFDAWDDYEHGKTAEGRFVKEMDKLECILQAQEYDSSSEMPDRFEEFKGLSSKISSAEGKLVLDMLQRRTCENERKKHHNVLFVTGDQSIVAASCDRLRDEFGMQHLSLHEILRTRSECHSDALSSYIWETLEEQMDVPAQLSLKLLEETLDNQADDRWVLVEGFSEQLLLSHKQQPRKPYYFLHIVGTTQCGRWEGQMNDAGDRSVIRDTRHFRQIQHGDTQQETWDSVKSTVQTLMGVSHSA